MEKCVLAYSGGLDTSAAIPWIKENHGTEVVAVSADIGEEKSYEALRQKALDAGAVDARVIDAKERFATEFVWPALAVNAVYEHKYHLATALARPLIASIMVDVAHQVGATAVAHGSTGKGNDQVRFDVTFLALDPNLKIIAPARDWGMTRQQTIAYAQQRGIPVPVGVDSPYSIDLNLWGRSIECGVLEEMDVEPPEEVFALTVPSEKAPDEPRYLDVELERGVPVALDGKRMGGAEIIAEANRIGGAHGIGRVDMVENRLVGIKSREVYECPGAVLLTLAHRELEAVVLDRDLAHFKALVEQRYAELVYYGLWFSPLRQALDAFVKATQERVCGRVRLKLFKGSCSVVGRESEYSLYDPDWATYGAADKFDHSWGVGFSRIWGLPIQIAAEKERGAKSEG